MFRINQNEWTRRPKGRLNQPKKASTDHIQSFVMACLFTASPPSGGTPLYESYKYVPPQRARCCAVLVSKQVFKLTLLILVWNCIWFARELGECTNVFIVSFQTNKKERQIRKFEMNFKKYFLLLF